MDISCPHELSSRVGRAEFDTGATSRDNGGMSDDSEITLRITAGHIAVLAQTELLHRDFGQAVSQWKSDGTRVTATDIAISENIFASLAESFPDDQFFSEELTEADAPIPVKARYCWVLDPIDGTNNFATGIPHCAIGLALLEDGQPIYGFVYDLGRSVLIRGGPGHGVWEGEKKVGLKDQPLAPESVVAFHSPHEKTYAPHASILADHFKLRALVTSTIHLAYVGNGLFDAVVDHNVKVWDIAAAVPLILAGGGAVEFITESPFPLREFDLKMSRIFYLAGTRDGVAELERLLSV